MVSDKPTNHPRISDAEKQYITKAIEESTGKHPGKVRKGVRVLGFHSFYWLQNVQPPPIPWVSILKSKAVWACWIGHFAGDWGAYTILVSLPSFVEDVLGLNLSSVSPSSYCYNSIRFADTSFLHSKIFSKCISLILKRSNTKTVEGDVIMYSVKFSLLGCIRSVFVQMKILSWIPIDFVNLPVDPCMGRKYKEYMLANSVRCTMIHTSTSWEVGWYLAFISFSIWIPLIQVDLVIVQLHVTLTCSAILGGFEKDAAT